MIAHFATPAMTIHQDYTVAGSPEDHKDMFGWVSLSAHSTGRSDTARHCSA